MICTVAIIVSVLGYMPPKGTVITVPASQVQQMTPRQKSAAIRCANKYGILWQIDEAR